MGNTGGRLQPINLPIVFCGHGEMSKLFKGICGIYNEKDAALHYQLCYITIVEICKKLTGNRNVAIEKINKFRSFLIKMTEHKQFESVNKEMADYYRSLVERMDELEKRYNDLFRNPQRFSSKGKKQYDCDDFTQLPEEAREKCNFITDSWIALNNDYVFIINKLNEFRKTNSVSEILKFLKTKNQVAPKKAPPAPKKKSDAEQARDLYIAKDNELRACMAENRQLKEALRGYGLLEDNSSRSKGKGRAR